MTPRRSEQTRPPFRLVRHAHDIVWTSSLTVVTPFLFPEPYPNPSPFFFLLFDPVISNLDHLQPLSTPVHTKIARMPPKRKSDQIADLNDEELDRQLENMPVTDSCDTVRYVCTFPSPPFPYILELTNHLSLQPQDPRPDRLG